MKDILEKLVSGEIDIVEAENLIKSENILEFDDVTTDQFKHAVETLQEEGMEDVVIDLTISKEVDAG